MEDSPGGTSYDRYTNLRLTRGDSEYWVNIAVSDDYQDYNVVVVVGLTTPPVASLHAVDRQRARALP